VFYRQHCIDATAGVVQGTAGYIMMFQGKLTGLTASVEWIAGDRVSSRGRLCVVVWRSVTCSTVQTVGNLTWTYSADYKTITGITAVNGSIPPILNNGFVNVAVDAEATPAVSVFCRIPWSFSLVGP
jgi:hypothetical protein